MKIQGKAPEIQDVTLQGVDFYNKGHFGNSLAHVRDMACLQVDELELLVVNVQTFRKVS